MKNATLKQARKIIEVFEDTSLERVQDIVESGLLADIRDCDISKVNRDEVRKVLGLEPLMPKPEPLLESLGTVVVPATTKKFVAKDRFVVDTSRKAKVKISGLGDNFNDRFLNKTEEPISETTLHYHKLRQSSVDKPIIAELGGEAKAETSLTEMFALMELQGNGENGVMLTNGYANIFYIRDVAGALCAVHAYWRGDGWRVAAYSVAGPDGWRGGRRVFSRNS